ncbi:MAG: hypothetical protein JWP07_71 [Pseudonocardiales bacterium]|nr:hypothetical protein [Pseudonocardiales bacterium]
MCLIRNSLWAHPGGLLRQAQGHDLRRREDPAGFATSHVGLGPCLRHGGADWTPNRPRGARTPPGWKREGERSPLATILRLLAAAKRAAQPFPLAWADALYDALDGLEDRDFSECAGVLLATSRAWMDAYDDRRSKLTELRSRESVG